MDDKNQFNLGLSTRTALLKLRDDIRTVIEEHKQRNRMGYYIYIKSIISKILTRSVIELYLFLTSCRNFFKIYASFYL